MHCRYRKGESPHLTRSVGASGQALILCLQCVQVDILMTMSTATQSGMLRHGH